MQAERRFVVGNEMLLTASASLGWRHAFADTHSATYMLAGGTAFTVAGVPVASDMLTMNAGLTLDVSKTTMIDFSYGLLLGDSAHPHPLKGAWVERFSRRKLSGVRSAEHT